MSEAFWALGRGTGVVLLVLLTGTVLLGVLTRSGRPLVVLPRFAVSLLHRDLALLSIGFLVVHVLSLLGDPYAQLRLVDVVVPFLNRANPAWLGLGTLACDAMLALTVTGLLRRRIGQRAFRAVHWIAYGAWPLAVLHGLGEGSDARTRFFLALVGVCVLAVLAAAVWRTTTGFVEHRATRLRSAA